MDLYKFCNTNFFFLNLASPAASKLALRMTTLHEEPIIRQTCLEEDEDHYSEPEYNDYDYNKETAKAGLPKLKSSYTVESFLSIDKSQSTLLKSDLIKPSKNLQDVKNNHTTTPSMSSSTSSGYDSQAVSCTNLSNDDTLSFKSSSVDETPGGLNINLLGLRCS